ncbi:unnamed protein product [Tilletia controversa]|nr:hypothetical protein CF328_g4618 [Tilletia controversa]CAD6907077.1 unnamed protein product [Tilletia controversa]
MAATAYNVLEEQYELYSANQHAPSSSRVTLDTYHTRHQRASPSNDTTNNNNDDDDDVDVRGPNVSQKAIASLTGAIVTSVFMTPFDVIKTRLQVQGAFVPPPLSFDAHHTHLLRPQTAMGSAASAASSSSATSLPTRPGYQHLTGLFDGVSKVWRAEGAGGLWRGLSPTLVMTVPSQVTYMTCYDYLRTYFLSLKSDSTSATYDRRNGPIPGTAAVTAHSLLSSLAAGALARSVSATLVTPLELVRTRTQASSSLPSSSSASSSSSSSSAPSSLSGIIRTLAQETARGGPTVLWRGLGSTLWRDVPFSAVYFAGYEGLKRLMTGGGLGEGNASNHTAEFGISFASGSISGSAAALLTQPFDVIKTRLQTEARVGGRSSESPSASGTTSSIRTSRASAQSRSTFVVAREIFAKEGSAGLFKGLSPRIAKVAPACGVMIASFEVVGRALASRE